MSYDGGCLCGAIGYQATREPVNVGYCHCRMCQVSSGAPILPWASFATDSFAYVQGEPVGYRSSPRGQREFCRKCGSQLTFRDAQTPGVVDVNIGTLSEPAAVSPTYHIWYASRIDWFETTDDLPRYPGALPDPEQD